MRPRSKRSCQLHGSLGAILARVVGRCPVERASPDFGKGAFLVLVAQAPHVPSSIEVLLIVAENPRDAAGAEAVTCMQRPVSRPMGDPGCGWMVVVRLTGASVPADSGKQPRLPERRARAGIVAYMRRQPHTLPLFGRASAMLVIARPVASLCTSNESSRRDHARRSWGLSRSGKKISTEKSAWVP